MKYKQISETISIDGHPVTITGAENEVLAGLCSIAIAYYSYANRLRADGLRNYAQCMADTAGGIDTVLDKYHYCDEQ